MEDMPTQDIKLIIDGRHYTICESKIETEKLNITQHIPWITNWDEISQIIEAEKVPLKVHMDVSKFVAIIKDTTETKDLAEVLIQKIGYNNDVYKNKIISYDGKMWEIKDLTKIDDDYSNLCAEELITQQCIEKEAARLLKEKISERNRRSNSKTDGGD